MVFAEGNVMKPTSYKNTPLYGQAQAELDAKQSNSPQAVKTIAPQYLEAQFYQDSLNRSLQLGYMGLQKDMFNENLAENKRQFDTGMAEGKRQFGVNLQFARDQFKYARRQDNRAELLAMANVGVGLGMGYLQYKQARKQLQWQKVMMAKLEAAMSRES
jgi:hypothetical protein